MLRTGVCTLALLIGITSVAAEPRELGTYERYALDAALSRLGLEVDPAPDGKVLGAIHVVNRDVFSPRDGFLQIFNFFHRTSRNNVIEREVLLRPGQMWDHKVIEETGRKLRDPIYSTLVVMVPVKSATPGQVDLLVVTRDVWSLRLNSDFEIQDGSLTSLTISLAENNFLGWRKTVAMAFDMDQGSFALGPLYLDKNVLGRKLQLFARAQAIFNRQTQEQEGERVDVILTRPLWSLSSKWGGSVSFAHFDAIIRRFQGNQLFLHQLTVPNYFGQECPDDDPACATVGVPHEFDFRRTQVEYSGIYSIGEAIEHQFTLGHRVRVARPGLRPGFPGSRSLQRQFADLVLPRSERSSAVFFRYRLFEPEFVKLRNIDTYDLSEDVRFGPLVQVDLSAALTPIGSENTFFTGGLAGSWTWPWHPGGFVRASTSNGTRLQDGELVDNTVSAGLRVVTPMFGDAVRVVALGQVSVRTNDVSNSPFLLGGTNGLRGYPINAFIGNFVALGNIEIRSAPIKLGFTRFGGLVFAEVGDAPDTASQFVAHADAGIGLRFLIPQLSPQVYRLDWAIPLEGPTAGFPGRITLGSGQVF